MLKSESLFILQQLMEKSTEMSESLAEVRPLNKTSPATSSESDKGVDCSHEPPHPTHKKRRRGKHRRKWKPYSSMTVEERKEEEARGAARVAEREARLAGKPSAPWNTTQFIMEDRGCNEVKIPTPRASRTLSLDDSLSEEDFYESPEDELFEHRNMLEQEFESTYQEVANERLQGLSKAELVDECIELERVLNTVRDQGQEDVCKLSMEVSELRAQVEILQKENNDFQILQQEHHH